jgi:hypothetical protein
VAIVSALDPLFIKRLLVTDQSLNVKGSVPPSTDALALSMLSFLCADHQVAGMYADMIPTVVDKLKTHSALLLRGDKPTSKDTPSAADTNVESVILDGLRFLCMFASRGDILQAVAAGIVPLCARAAIISTSSPPPPSAPATSSAEYANAVDARPLSLTMLKRCFAMCPVASVQALTEEHLLILVESLCSILPAQKSSRKTPSCDLSSDSNASTFGGGPEDVSLRALHVLELVMRAGLGATELEGRPVLILRGEWPALLRQGLGGVLRNRLSEVHRNRCFSVSDCMIALAGASWAVATVNAPSGGSTQVAKTPGSFVVLLIQLACVEVRLLVDTIARLLVDGAGNQEELDQERHRLERALTVLPMCFSLMEQSVKALCEAMQEPGEHGDPGSWAVISGTELLSLRDAMVNAVKALCGFVKYVGREPPAFYLDAPADAKSTLNQNMQAGNECGDLGTQEDSPEGPTLQMHMLENTVRACVRVVGMWLAVDADSILLEATELIRYVLGRDLLPGFKRDGTVGSVQHFFIGGGLVALLQESSARSELYQCGGQIILAEYVARCLAEVAASFRSSQPMGSALVASTLAALEVCTVLVRDFGPSDSRGSDAARDFARTVLREIGGASARALRELLLPLASRCDASSADAHILPRDAEYIIALLEATTLSLPPGPRGV